VDCRCAAHRTRTHPHHAPAAARPRRPPRVASPLLVTPAWRLREEPPPDRSADAPSPPPPPPPADAPFRPVAAAATGRDHGENGHNGEAATAAADGQPNGAGGSAALPSVVGGGPSPAISGVSTTFSPSTFCTLLSSPDLHQLESPTIGAIAGGGGSSPSRKQASAAFSQFKRKPGSSFVNLGAPPRPAAGDAASGS